MNKKLLIKIILLTVILFAVISCSDDSDDQYTLAITVSPEDAGTIVISPDEDEYDGGSAVLLTAVADTGYIFESWSGSITGTINPIMVIMDENKSITVGFTDASLEPVLINFDDIAAQELFVNTMALSDEYSSLGVNFAGPGANDGGGVLLDSTWHINGHSSPNILCFNTAVTYPDGGTASGPETISFDTPAAEVSILAGRSDAGVVTMNAYDDSDNLVDVDQLTASEEMAKLSVSDKNICYIVISFTGTACVLDDLFFMVYAGQE